MISANGGLPAHRYTPQVTPRWPQGSEPASVPWWHKSPGGWVIRGGGGYKWGWGLNSLQASPCSKKSSHIFFDFLDSNMLLGVINCFSNFIHDVDVVSILLFNILVTQIQYASLLATKWLIERLGNRSSAGRQQTGRPSRRRRKMGRVIPVPASDHRKKGTCRLLTVQCKYLVCFYAFYYYILSSLHFAAQNVSGWTRPVQEFVQH